MSVEKEGTHRISGPEPVDLYTKTWLPKGEVKAKLIFIHGFSDHMGRYLDFFPSLAAKGIAVHGLDQRGWGRSVKKTADRGQSGPTTLVISDIVSFIKSELPSPVPVFVMGHSMGGGEVLTLASDPLYEDLMPQIRGWLTESALLGFPPSMTPSPIEVWLGRHVAKIIPRIQRFSKIPAEYITRDPEVRKEIEADTLCHNMGTLQGLSGMLDRMSNLAQGKVKLNKGVTSIWISHGTGDLTTSHEASEKWVAAQTIADKTFKSYPEAGHQLHSDTPEIRKQFADDVAEWILARSDKPAEASTAKL